MRLLIVYLSLMSAVIGQTLPSVGTGSADQIGNTSARLSGSVNPNWTTVYWQFEIGTTVSYGTFVPKSLWGGFSGGGNTNESWTAVGLTPGTLYHFRMDASNANGAVYGGDSTFTTTGGSPTPTPSPTPAPNVLAWDPPSTVTGYEVSYGTVNGGPYPNVVDAGNNTTLTLTGLVSGATYYAIVQSYDVNHNLSCTMNQLTFVAK